MYAKAANIFRNGVQLHDLGCGLNREFLESAKPGFRRRQLAQPASAAIVV
jgi:hypothetical protein